jgi:hypothetical protein
MSNTEPRIELTNGELKRADWIWIRGRKVVVREDAEPCLDTRYVNVIVQNRQGGRSVETMVRSRKRKVVRHT